MGTETLVRFVPLFLAFRREDGSPSWGRKLLIFFIVFHLSVEKMGPLRGDGNFPFSQLIIVCFDTVEKMGPLRGDGNSVDEEPEEAFIP